jgi:putative alpha-1,2-mannosidase
LAGDTNTWLRATTCTATEPAAVAAWHPPLGKIWATGGRSPSDRLYSALYHLLLHPNVLSDDNGQ